MALGAHQLDEALERGLVIVEKEDILADVNQLMSRTNKTNKSEKARTLKDEFNLFVRLIL